MIRPFAVGGGVRLACGATLFFLPGLARAQDAAATLAELSARQDTLTSNLNLLWVLVAAALVFLMQAGFMCLESGLATAKNSINVAIKNLADFLISVVGFWALGFGLMFGATEWGWFGTSHFFIDVDDGWTAAFFIFQAVFVGTAATIDSGALAGRTRFGAYLVLSAVVSLLIYPVFGHWAWGSLLLGGEGGWLEGLGFKDFAGSTVVHSVGGWTALVGVVVVGPRIGKFDAQGQPRRIPPHNLTLSYLGTFILFFGWFGFNAGSTLEVTPDLAPIAFNTMLAGCFGGVVSAALSWWRSPFRRPEGEMIANGVLGGLVGITAGCAFVNAWGAAAIGVGAGALVYYGVLFIERVLKLDDVVGAIAVHGLCGAWGTVAVGLFITGAKLGEMSRLEQLFVQVVGVVTCFAWTLGVGYVTLRLIDRYGGGMRVSAEDEQLGLNVAEHGASSTLLDVVQAMHTATRDGDFTQAQHLEVEHGTEAGELARGFNTMVDAVRRALQQRQAQEERVHQAMAQLQAEREQAEEQRRQYLAETTARVGEVIGHTESSFGRISTADHDLADGMTRLQDESQEIDKVVVIIDSLSRQINMLAINAMIEAAKAGDSGRTFLVVAQEVKRLGENTKHAAQDVLKIVAGVHDRLRDLLESMTVQHFEVESGMQNIARAREMLAAFLGDGDAQSAPLGAVPRLLTQ